MTLTERRLLLAAFILIFACLSPLLILYASGYRYNTRLRKIEQVGLLSVSTVQQGATATIDGAPFELEKNTLLSTLPPRDYVVTLAKEGYHSWSKPLTIEEGRTTFAMSVRLFPDVKATPVELFTSPLLMISENDALAAYQGVAGIVTYDKKSGEIQEWTLPTAAAVQRAALFDRTMVFQQDAAWYAINIGRDEQPIIIEAPEQTKAVIPADDALYLLTSDRVWESKNGQVTPLFSISEPETIWAKGKSFFVMTTEATRKHSFLYYLPDLNARPQFMASFPYASSWTLSQTGALLTAHDNERQNLALIDTQAAPAAVVTLEGVQTWHWSKDKRSLLTLARHELSVYHVQNGASQELIVRQSAPMLDAAWGPEESWVLFTTEDGVFAAERDNRGSRNVIELATEKKTPHVLGVSASALRFSSQEGQSFVIWEYPFEAEL